MTKDEERWVAAVKNKTGVMVTTFQTRIGRMRARLQVDEENFYTGDFDSLSELFAALSESARKAEAWE